MFSSQNLFAEIRSPLDQFEIRDILNLEALGGNLHLSLTNIGFYLIIGAFITLILSLVATNYNKLVSNNWSIAQESLYVTIHNIVTNQINARSGQIYFPFIYTLFVFILINNLIGMVKRCLWVTFNIYIFIIFSAKNMVNTYSSFTYTSKSACISTSSSHKPIPSYKNSYYLHPYYITGFVDGEGCFTTSIYKDSRMSTGWQVKPIFKISLHNMDRNILEAIQRTLGVGKIYKHGYNSLEYRVSSLKNIKVIIDHFDKYPLITQKLADYLLFKESVNLIEKKEHLTYTGLLKLVGIKSGLNRGLSEKFYESFSGIVPAERPVVKPIEIQDTNWLRGFVEAEGSFQVIIQESKDKTVNSISLRFTITQHSRDSLLLESFVNYLGCGRCYSDSKREEINFIVSVFSDISNKIVPLFNEYPLIGTKKENYLDFFKVVELIKSK